jgi:hypothetical protein
MTSNEQKADIDWMDFFRGLVKRGSFVSMGTVENSARSRMPIKVSAASNPRLGVMICTPGMPSGGSAKWRA